MGRVTHFLIRPGEPIQALLVSSPGCESFLTSAYSGQRVPELRQVPKVGKVTSRRDRDHIDLAAADIANAPGKRKDQP
ncbi:hypothetical protein [Rhodococcus sp. UNC363MFTsu5.1]|uniref:hypothetical protein n=1 Tax=Rhodococcus sp. UNC363MFTsu5.1 TaxID=1449069 RepID=UPI00048990BB|nr:hypothetical protein [Rhodococcus sp. UNC363MFTsu5.1]